MFGFVEGVIRWNVRVTAYTLTLVTALNLDVGRWMWWPSKLAHTPDPAPAELGHERAAALAGR